MKKKTKKVLCWIGLGVAVVATVAAGIAIYNAGHAAGTSDTEGWFEDVFDICIKPEAEYIGQ